MATSLAAPTPSYDKLFVPEKALQQQLKKVLPLCQTKAKERGSLANFCRFGIILKTTGTRRISFSNHSSFAKPNTFSFVFGEP